MPLHFDEIQNLYKSEFFKEFEKVKEISAMIVGSAKILLEEGYGLFLEGHTSHVSSVAITSDNKYIVSGGHDNTVRIWSLQDKTQEAVLKGHSHNVKCVAITSDNKYVVSGGDDNTVRIWNLQDKTQEAVLKGHTNNLRCVSITSDNKYVFWWG